VPNNPLLHHRLALGFDFIFQELGVTVWAHGHRRRSWQQVDPMVERAEWRKALWICKQIGELIQEGGQEVATVAAVRGGVWLWTPLHWTWWSWRQNTMVRLEKSQSIGPSERSQS